MNQFSEIFLNTFCGKTNFFYNILNCLLKVKVWTNLRNAIAHKFIIYERVYFVTLDNA